MVAWLRVVGMGVLFSGCSWIAPPTDPCSDDTQVLTTAGEQELTCEEAKRPTRYLRVIAGRPLAPNSTATGVYEVKRRFESDPAATQAWLDRIAELGMELESKAGLSSAALRSRRVWEAQAGEGPIPADDSTLGNLQRTSLSVWVTDDKAKMALTEMDMEGWIYYGSLCRQMQGGGSLKVSISDRQAIYQMLTERFEFGSEDEKAALAGLGPFWTKVRSRFNSAEYEDQQVWVKQSELPPPMTTTSKGYIEAVLESDVVANVNAVHDVFGPFTLKDGPGYFRRNP